MHNEDVRRANGRGPRSLAPAMDAALWRNVRRGARFLSRRLRGCGLEVEWAGAGEVVRVRPGEPAVRLSGAPGELSCTSSGGSRRRESTSRGRRKPLRRCSARTSAYDVSEWHRRRACVLALVAPKWRHAQCADQGRSGAHAPSPASASRARTSILAGIPSQSSDCRREPTHAGRGVRPHRHPPWRPRVFQSCRR